MNLYLDAKGVIMTEDYCQIEEGFNLIERLKGYGIDVIVSYRSVNEREKFQKNFIGFYELLIDRDCVEIEYDLDEYEIYVSADEDRLFKSDMDLSVLFRQYPNIKNCCTNPNHDVYICKSYDDIYELVTFYYGGKID